MEWRVDRVLSGDGFRASGWCSPVSRPDLVADGPRIDGAAASHFAKIFYGDASTAGFAYFQRQATLAALIRQPGHLPLVASQVEESAWLLIFPKLQALPLDVWLSSLPLQPLRSEAMHIARQLLAALEALHTQGYVHGNLRPEHILIDDRSQLWLVGLGHCEEIGERVRLTRPARPADPPETRGGEFEASSAQDIFAAAHILSQFGGALGTRSPIFRAMQAPDPEDRPTSGELQRLLCGTGGQSLWCPATAAGLAPDPMYRAPRAA